MHENLKEIYESYYKNIYNYISFRINRHHDTEDLTSKVFEKVIVGLKTYNPIKSPIEAWLIGIAKNVVNDYLKSQRKIFFIQIEEIFDLKSNLKTPEEIIVKQDENLEIIKAMSKLPDRYRNILSMKFATDLTNSEIAKILMTNEAHVRVVISRAIKKLKLILEKENNHER